MAGRGLIFRDRVVNTGTSLPGPDHVHSQELCEGVFWPYAMFVALADCGSLDLKKFSGGYWSYAHSQRMGGTGFTLRQGRSLEPALKRFIQSAGADVKAFLKRRPWCREKRKGLAFFPLEHVRLTFTYKQRAIASEFQRKTAFLCC